MRLSSALGPSILLAGASLVGSAPHPATARADAATGPSSQPSTQELLDRVRALEAEVADLKGRLPVPPPSTLPAAVPPGASGPPARTPTDATADAVLRDANRRSQLPGVGSNFTAGYVPDRGFILRSEDGSFLLHPWAFAQFRNVTTYRAKADAAGNDDLQNGFEVRRAKFLLDGNAFSPDLTYLFIWGTDRKTGNLVLEDAWARYHLGDTPFSIRVGQIRDPLDHEQILLAARVMTADRSLVDDVLAAVEGSVQGVSLGYERGPVRAEFAVSDGLRSANTNFQDFPTNSADWGVAGRVEYKVMGKWDAYNDFTALGDDEPMLIFGAGADYTEAGDTGALVHVVDAAYESPGGLSLYAAYLGRYVRHNTQPPGSNGGATGTPATTADTYDASVRVQAAYVFNQKWEPFARYEYVYFDSALLPVTVSHRPVHEITAGVNYYFYKHRAKLTADVLYLPNGSPVTDDGAGILSNRGGTELIFRMQFQLVL